jgi:hypothetical protein
MKKHRKRRFSQKRVLTLMYKAEKLANKTKNPNREAQLRKLSDKLLGSLDRH